MISVSRKTNLTLSQQMPKDLVLFDFDGTITTKDTLAEFMKFYHGNVRYAIGLAVLSPILASYIFKLMPNWKSKQYFLSWFLKDENVDKFNEKCLQFSKHYLPKLIRPQALESVHEHKKRGATVAVVSASAEHWVKPWCDEQGILCIATKLEIKDNKLTGNLSGKNCHGPEKVCRIKENFTLKEYKNIIAYGDTSGDKEMLAIANQKFYKPFRT